MALKWPSQYVMIEAVSDRYPQELTIRLVSTRARRREPFPAPGSFALAGASAVGGGCDAHACVGMFGDGAEHAHGERGHGTRLFFVYDGLPRPSMQREN